jgi:DNA-binding response OmpR family regulator
MWRVLVVTESPPRFTEFAKNLREEGQAECVWAENPEAAIGMAVDQRPHLVVVDDTIGGTSGLEWVKRLLTVDAFLNTALVSSLDEAEFHEAGEGLGIALQLSPYPDGSDARKVLGWLASAGPAA